MRTIENILSVIFSAILADVWFYHDKIGDYGTKFFLVFFIINFCLGVFLDIFQKISEKELDKEE